MSGTPSPAPKAAAATGASGLISQFTGNAGWGILVGLVTIIVPLAFQRVYFFLPIIGLIVAIYAIVKKQVIGGVVGLILNVVGGILTIIGLTQG